MSKVKILFSDFFDVEEEKIETYGAFNISLLSDLPLFIDPFLLFNSQKTTYKNLHTEIIKYLQFLKEKSISGTLNPGLISTWYKFKEVHQTWLGFSTSGNRGSGLGNKFADALNENFGKIFKNYGSEKITLGTHLEKLCLVKEGVGRDSISDFTTNLIKSFLVEYTESFAKTYIHESKCKICIVEKVVFNYETESWESREYYLPWINNDYVLLTPKDILTRDSVWINKEDLYKDFSKIQYSLTNQELRSQLNNYLHKIIGFGNHTQKKRHEAIHKALLEFPELIDHYVRYKEEHGDSAIDISSDKVKASENLYIKNFKEFANSVRDDGEFDKYNGNSYEEIIHRAKYLKHRIEDCDGYRIFYHDQKPQCREVDLKILFLMTWYASPYDTNTEVNNGRGPADLVVSKGSKDKALAEFKLASNSQLKTNLQNQTQIYEKAAVATHKTVKMILYFSLSELEKVKIILKDLNLENDESIILIDARSDNKVSASKAK